ncbi:MAG: allantoicase [Ferruginibacter sp.]|nr:allantoicase [Bacteroidota bacterium]MBX2917998.1 allantoicase [Ferruginibacter sp.]MCB0708715.1 allantoicase [Chitinophagaceae bacterium]MCC7379456.1 allantoicase [Chitinophagaceae bacterium]
MAFEKVKEIIKDSPAFTKLTDLAAAKLGGKVLFATDDFFAEKENLIKPTRGIFIADKYTDRGKWMDGWESRRKRTAGHDWAVIQLATPGKITGLDIDTNFFLGNHPPHASVEAVNITDASTLKNLPANETGWENIGWKEILPKSNLDAGSQNFFQINSNEIFTHIRLHIYPDGGVARCRVYGEVFKNWNIVAAGEEVDLVAAINGGKAIACNDMFFSSMSNLIMPNRGVNMGDGWETKRNRTPGNRDWVILKLATAGIVNRIIVDTAHFKGNYPDSCTIEACYSNNDDDVVNNKVEWSLLLPQQKLSADKEHEFAKNINCPNSVSHVRLNIFPDGGVSRIRLFGTIKN